MAAAALDSGEFEGFQGSGAMGSPPGLVGLTKKAVPTRSGGGGGGVVQAEVDDPDLDGSHYARSTPSRTKRGSDTTRSRTSASSSGQNKPKKPRSSGSSGAGSSSTTTTTTTSSQDLSPRQLVSPSTVEQGQGFFDLEEDDVRVAKSGGYLPITGFGGASGTNRMASSLGAALAQRGQ